MRQDAHRAWGLAVVWVAASAALCASPGQARASALRVDVTPEGAARAEAQAPSGAMLRVEVTVEVVGAQAVVRVAMPADQLALKHHWRTDVWRLGDDGGAESVAPLQLTRDAAGVLRAAWSGPADQLGRVAVVVRCGPHAPLAETLFWIEPARWRAPRRDAKTPKGRRCADPLRVWMREARLGRRAGPRLSTARGC